MATIQERKSSNGKIRYRVQIRLRGEKPVSQDFERKTDAKNWAQKIESDIKDGKYFKTAEAKKHTVGEMIDRYIKTVLPYKPKSERKQKAQLLRWKELIGHNLLSNLTPPLIADIRDKLKEEITPTGRKRGPATVVRYMAAFSHVCTIASKEWGWLDDSPCRKVSKPKEPRGIVRFLDEHERQRLLETCKKSRNPYLYIIVVLALSTGMRQGEILHLTWSDVDLQRGKLILHETKNGERRGIPITGHALHLLQELYKIRRADSLLLFPGKIPHRSIDIRHAWESAIKQANVYNFRFHDLRHSAASYLIMNNASSSVISELLGHKSSLQMVKRYAHLSEGHIAEAVADMNQKIFREETV
jgi:integrase